MSGTITIAVSGVPVPKGRPRMTRGGFIYTPAHTRKYEDVVRLAASHAMDGRDPLDEPISLKVAIELPVPQSWSGKKQREALAGRLLPTSRPDADNYLKLAMDACNGVVFRDDCLITDIQVTKRYGPKPSLTIEAAPAWREVVRNLLGDAA